LGLFALWNSVWRGLFLENMVSLSKSNMDIIHSWRFGCGGVGTIGGIVTIGSVGIINHSIEVSRNPLMIDISN